jgi:hypothetical protein
MSYPPFNPKQLREILKSKSKYSKTRPEPWSCYLVMRPFYLLHVLKRNESDCFLPTLHHKLIYLDCSGTEVRTGLQTKNLRDLIRRAYGNCDSKKKILMVPIVIHAKEGVLHENILIINTIRKEAERFEPHGSKTLHPHINSDSLDTSIGEFVKDLKLGLKYVPSTEVSQFKDGFQALESKSQKLKTKKHTDKGMRTMKDPDGFCAAWSYFYADLRLKFPQRPARELTNYIKEILGDDPDTLREFIRGQSVSLRRAVADLDKYLDFMELAEPNSAAYEKAEETYQRLFSDKMTKYTVELRKKEEKKGEKKGEKKEEKKEKEPPKKKSKKVEKKPKKKQGGTRRIRDRVGKGEKKRVYNQV